MNTKNYLTRVPDIDSDGPASKALNDWYVDLLASYDIPEMGIPERRIFFEHWGDFGREPEDVDYIDTKIAGVKCLWAIPHGCDESRILLCVHGGGYIYGNRFTHRKGYSHMAKAIGCKALLVDYRQTPEHKWPAPLEDVVKVYQELLGDGIDAKHIAVTGDSCGGALCLSLLLTLKEQNIPMLAAAMPVSPWIDCMASTSMYDTNDKDVLNTKESVLGFGMSLKDAGVNIEDPHVAPIHLTEEQMKGFPPIYITVGGYENMAEEAEIVSETAFRAGVAIKLDIVEHMQHSLTQIAGACQNADDQMKRFSEWVRPILELS